MAIKIGQVIDDKYEIVRLIGEGGMGAVYEGRNRFISRTVAIKVLLPTAVEADPSAVKRFEREAQAAGRIGSDHILEVIDLGSLASGERYLVMEYLEGETLAERIRRLGRLAPRELHPILAQALHGLSAAHRAGIVHRDLKPDNLFILREKAGTPDFVKIIDFGISKFCDPGTEEMSMTRTGALMGTPYYMSPEQAKGADGVNHQTDLYSLGVIAFEAITGNVPYDGDTFNDLMFKIVLSDMPNPESLVGGLDPGFCAIVRRAMERDLRRRFATADDFLAALDRWSPMAATVADGTPMSVQGEGMTGEHGLQTLTPLSEVGGAIASLLTDGAPPVEELGPRDRQPKDRSGASLAATSLVDQRSIPSTKVIPSSLPKGGGAADSDPNIPSTNAAPRGAAARKKDGTDIADSSSGQQRAPDEGASGTDRDHQRDPGGATLESPAHGAANKKGGRHRKGELTATTPSRDSDASPPTEPLPFSRTGRPAHWVSFLIAALCIGALLLVLLPGEDGQHPEVLDAETAALQTPAPPPPSTIAPIELEEPRSPEAEDSLLDEEETGSAAPEVPQRPAPPKPAPRPAAQPTSKPLNRKVSAPSPTAPVRSATRPPAPAPSPTPRASASFEPPPPPPKPSPKPRAIPRDFGY